MAEWRMGLIESRFADLIWSNEPLTSTQLVKLAGEALGWKKSTTYTVLKRLCQRGIFQNQNGTVTSLLSRQEFQARQSEEFIADSFGGSLPAFLTSFTTRKKLSQEEIVQLQELIDRSRG
ncbi:MAG TPA: BlaI/MecI/CopY family transcriptional regulator [Candidatus Enterenecus stercoripullorum]|nr:BlaI/MecI/CopY family transcriptional regulator [Candidatus Enterenecus stercoripullorum]